MTPKTLTRPEVLTRPLYRLLEGDAARDYGSYDHGTVHRGLADRVHVIEADCVLVQGGERIRLWPGWTVREGFKGTRWESQDVRYLDVVAPVAGVQRALEAREFRIEPWEVAR